MPFFPRSPVITGFYLLVEATGAVPSIDVATTCRAGEKAVIAIVKETTGLANFDGCMKQETAARETLVRDWATYPAADRARCVAPARYMPSYVEWLSCLETAKVVREIRREP